MKFIETFERRRSAPPPNSFIARGEQKRERRAARGKKRTRLGDVRNTRARPGHAGRARMDIIIDPPQTLAGSFTPGLLRFDVPDASPLREHPEYNSGRTPDASPLTERPEHNSLRTRDAPPLRECPEYNSGRTERAGQRSKRRFSTACYGVVASRSNCGARSFCGITTSTSAGTPSSVSISASACSSSSMVRTVQPCAPNASASAR